jgi:predicted SnoaL-like aldol condensation-catalyzing enzyme
MNSTSHKDAATSFLNIVVAGRIPEAYAQYVGDPFRHHHPFCEGDKDSLIKAMEENEITFPNKAIKIHRVLEDGNLVAVHSAVKLNDLNIAVFHIFRFENDKITELWDLGQQVPENSPNQNGMF